MVVSDFRLKQELKVSIFFQPTTFLILIVLLCGESNV
jgi:hypothetical protein